MFMPSVFKWLGLRPIFTAIWETKPVQAMLTPLEAILTSQNGVRIFMNSHWNFHTRPAFSFTRYFSKIPISKRLRLLKIEGNKN